MNPRRLGSCEEPPWNYLNGSLAQGQATGVCKREYDTFGVPLSVCLPALPADRLKT